MAEPAQARYRRDTTLNSPVTYLFTQTNYARLETFARSNVLLAFDFDGTLAPLSRSPSAARMRAATTRWFERVRAVYPCIVITGRAQADALGRLGDIAARRVVGNHGAEPSSHGRTIRRRARSWLLDLTRRLSTERGVLIEDKGLSLAIHYRHARNRQAARRAILAAAQSLNDVRIIGGKCVINLVVRDAPNKAAALERERVRLGCDTLIYIGDDETDEDVFALNRPTQLLSVRVGRDRASAASHYIRDQKEIDKLLRVLVSLRTPARAQL